MYVGAKNNQTLKETPTINTSHFKLHVPRGSQPFLSTFIISAEIDFLDCQAGVADIGKGQEPSTQVDFTSWT